MAAEAFNLGFIGAGKMAESIARGVSKSGVLPPSRISTAHRSADRRDAFSSFGVNVFHHNTQVPPSLSLSSYIYPSFSISVATVDLHSLVRVLDLDRWSHLTASTVSASCCICRMWVLEQLQTNQTITIFGVRRCLDFSKFFNLLHAKWDQTLLKYLAKKIK